MQGTTPRDRMQSELPGGLQACSNSIVCSTQSVQVREINIQDGGKSYGISVVQMCEAGKLLERLWSVDIDVEDEDGEEQRTQGGGRQCSVLGGL